MNCRKPLFVTDMDGTLLGADSRVSPRSAEIISELSRRGVMITVATARTPGTVEPLLAETLTTPPAVVMTGAAMWDRQNQRFKSAHLLAPEKAAEVCATLRTRGISPMVYQLNESDLLTMHCDVAPDYAITRQFIDERSSLTLKKVHHCADPEAHIENGRTILVLAAAPLALTESSLPAVKAIPGLEVAMYTDPVYPGAGFIEVFTEGVTKARGIHELKEATGADCVTVFGDNLNDIPMMLEADVAVAVENALPEVKAVANKVIGPNTADSVALYIQEQTQ